MLSNEVVGTSNFVPLITEDIWINVAKPRIIDIPVLESRDSPRATAQMEEKYIPHFAGLLGENRLSTIKARYPENMIIYRKSDYSSTFPKLEARQNDDG